MVGDDECCIESILLTHGEFRACIPTVSLGLWMINFEFSALELSTIQSNHITLNIVLRIGSKSHYSFTSLR